MTRDFSKFKMCPDMLLREFTLNQPLHQIPSLKTNSQVNIILRGERKHYFKDKNALKSK